MHVNEMTFQSYVMFMTKSETEHGLLKLEDGTLVLSRRVIACRVDFNHNLKQKGQSIEL
jgi:hypothetical protein